MYPSTNTQSGTTTSTETTTLAFATFTSSYVKTLTATITENDETLDKKLKTATAIDTPGQREFRNTE